VARTSCPCACLPQASRRACLPQPQELNIMSPKLLACGAAGTAHQHLRAQSGEGVHQRSRGGRSRSKSKASGCQAHGAV